MRIILQIALAVFLGMTASLSLFKFTASEPAPACAQISKR